MKNKENFFDIKRRLAVIITAAVFVIGTGSCPVSGFALENDETQSGVENTKVDSLEEETGTDEIDTKGMGHIDIPKVRDQLAIKKSKEPSYLKKKEASLQQSLEPYYYPWEQDYYQGYVDILDQGSTGLCWAYSICTAAQISYLKELSERSAIDDEYDLSPYDFGYYFYNRQPYPYGYTEKDKNVPLDDTWYDNGGNNVLSSIALANWMGLHSAKSKSAEASNAYDNKIILENAIYLPDEYKNRCHMIKEELAKEAIKEYGALSAALYIDQSMYMRKSYGDNYWSSYCNYKEASAEEWGTTNHEIAIVGWDDNFPKENFKSGNQPEKDGAWIVQNSWGSDDPGDGFIYVSYEDLSLGGAIALDMQPADSYDANYQYDGNSFDDWWNFPMNAQIGNVFTVSDDGFRHTIRAVGFQTWNKLKTQYRIKIYKHAQSTPSSGELAASFKVSTDYAGSYTFKLSDYDISPVYLNTGEKFAVVVQPLSTNDSDECLYIGIEDAYSYSYVRFESVGKAKTCYFRDSVNDRWEDVHGYDSSESFRIKAFTTKTERKSLSSAKATLSTINYDYTGGFRKPLPKVKYNGKELTKGVHYTLSYSKNKYPGTATIRIKGKGLYKGTVTKTFRIAPVREFEQAASTKKVITLKWKKSPKVDGYKIYRYASGEYKLIKTIKKNTTITYTDTGLKSGKTYKYKIRTYKKVGSKTYNGPKTAELKAKTK